MMVKHETCKSAGESTHVPLKSAPLKPTDANGEVLLLLMHQSLPLADKNLLTFSDKTIDPFK